MHICERVVYNSSMDPLPFFRLSVLNVLFIWLTCHTDGQLTGPIVTTKYGQVAGRRSITGGVQYEEYLGMPFALPPVDSLRWTIPQPPQPWEGVRDATKYSRHCSHFLAVLYQGIGMGGRYDEDCLYLNVWVPKGVEANQGKKLPVMVFIYGGSYMIGTGEMYPGYQLAIHGDMVVVNFNYRVNVFGFLSTGDSAAPGNYGMWDVEAALVWVQENIAAFSGNPDQVTIFGQSAGGAQVSHSVISPKLRGLFRSAIAITGGATMSFALDRRAPDSTAVLAEVLGCDGDGFTSDEVIECLRAVERDRLMFWSEVSQLAAFGGVKYGPVIDEDLIPLEPTDAFQFGYGRNVNFMTGYTYHDYAGFILRNPIAMPLLGDNFNWAATNESMYESLQNYLGNPLNADELIGQMFERYPGMNSADVDTRTEATVRAMTDWRYASRSRWEAATQASLANNRGSTYMYQFQHRFSFLVGYPSWVNGSHMDDLYGVFGDPYMKVYRFLFLRHDFDDLDQQVSKTIMDYYTNFAHTGNPNEGPYIVPVEWTQFDPAKNNYLHQAPTFSVEEFDAQTLENFLFWDDIWNQVEYPPAGRQRPSTYDVDEVAVSESSNKSKTRHLTKQDIDRGVELFRYRMRKLLEGSNGDLQLIMEEKINQMVNELTS